MSALAWRLIRDGLVWTGVGTSRLNRWVWNLQNAATRRMVRARLAAGRAPGGGR